VNESAEPPRRSIDIDIEYLLNRLNFNPRGHRMRLRPEAARWMGAPSTTNLRVSDTERNTVADKLSRHYAEGRLDESEFKERLDAAMSAKTQGDLAGLFDDLPPLASEPAPAPSRRRRLIPVMVMVAFVALAAGSTVSLWHVMQVPWLLIAVVGFFLWSRAGRRHHHHHDRNHPYR
jgi:hypothetical protein